ncbi:enoyl-CoA hydratase/isomerase family protein [Parahaliea sp. F7430]|uniref:Enoyl-CoA hydratase/isomerase family protein n=1 Tax=Sediminihaliea albiluteola TaxID=2758564 RepID=A0A7W2TUS2_9GAMM|nr:enoyl-CoA hydratase-related protein [Sediminihaliea albiluteola]MBA6412243.1 enoyl-CoA hydratase/isomerase family protein [Sediminihaliea albiluteola]
MTDDILIVDTPAEGVSRLTMNRPKSRNSLIHPLRGAILEQLQKNDMDPEIRVSIIRGAGTCFSAGYDLANGNEGHELPFFTAQGDSQWPRHVTDGWMSIWDMAKPVIAQVHGYCLAGGSELATGCDLVYCAEDAQIGYPAVRFGVPDMHFHAHIVGMRAAMEMMLTGDSITGLQAVELGWANAAVPEDQLDDYVIGIAKRITHTNPDILQINKRLVHRAMEAQGFRTAIRMGTELCALGINQESFQQWMAEAKQNLTAKLQERDAPHGDYRTSNAKK